MGLPHVVVRFYTNPDGRSARRTTVGVLAMLSVFYLMPTAYGVLGRIYASDLVASGQDRLRRADAARPDARRLGRGRAHRAARRPAPSRPSCPRRRGWWSRSAACSARTCSAAASTRSQAFRVGGVFAATGTLALVARHPGPAGRPRGRARVRRRRVDLLPAAAARHLVARADRPRRDRGHARRRGALGQRRARGDGGRGSRADGGVPCSRSRPCSRCRSPSRRWSGCRWRTGPGYRSTSAARWCGCTCPRRSRSTAAATSR